MKLAHIITSIAFSSALMGCQIEVTPLEEDSVFSSVSVTENSSTTTDTDTTTSTAENTSTAIDATDAAANQDSATGSDSAATEETATDTSTAGMDTGATDTVATNETGSTATDNTDTTVSAATLYWSAPLVRTNGGALSFSEIGGYEIRYKLPAEAEYSSVIINDASVEQYSFDTLDNVEAYRFEVAAFDVNGVYSEFVAAN